jgi:hypothetical protein
LILHVVLFRLRAELSASERQALAEAFAAALQAIPTVRRALVGRRFTHDRGYERMMRVNYEYAALLEFADRRGLMAYLEHPAHHQLGERFFTAFEDALMYDYELEEGQEGISQLLDAIRAGRPGRGNSH